MMTLGHLPAISMSFPSILIQNPNLLQCSSFCGDSVSRNPPVSLDHDLQKRMEKNDSFAKQPQVPKIKTFDC